MSGHYHHLTFLQLLLCFPLVAVIFLILLLLLMNLRSKRARTSVEDLALRIDDGLSISTSVMLQSHLSSSLGPNVVEGNR